MRIGGKLLILPVAPALGLLALAAPPAMAASTPHAPAIWAPHFPARAQTATPRHVTAAGTQSATYVSTKGEDTGTCPKTAPCATITYAESQTAIGGTIHVAAGTYNQSANLTQPLHLTGAGETKTIINGTNIDYGANGYYGLLAINNDSGTAGTIAITGMTVTDPYVTAAEYNDDQEPIDVANFDQQSGDTVTVTDVTFGPPQDEADYPGSGYYSLNSQVNSMVANDTATGMYSAYFAEGSGSGTTTFSHDTAAKLAGDEYQGTFYPAVGIFALADTSNTLTVKASYDSFTGYDGFGIAGEAGYSSGNCSNNVCTGGLVLTTSHNAFKLTAAPAGSGVAAISLYAAANDQLTASLSYSSGTVASPDMAVNVQNDSGTTNVTDTQNTIKVTTKKK